MRALRLPIALALLLVACRDEARAAEPGVRAEVRPVPEDVAPTPAPPPRARAGQGPRPDPFAAPLPETPCPDRPRVAIAHASAADLPTWLERAVAFRSPDGRRLRVAIANHPLELDAQGRFPRPGPGQARFEMDALRTRRGALAPRVLGAPDSIHGGLTHARIVSAGPLLTFGHRGVGQVELTAVAEDHVCGRVALDDGFGRVRGAFRAPIVGPLPP